MNNFNIHPDFKLNGISYSKEELKELAYSLVKEGAKFEMNLGDFLMDWLLPSQEIIVKTSGSTGIPKKIPLLKEHMVNSALATGAYFNLRPRDTVLHCLPMAYIAGKMLLVRALVLGLHIDIIAPTSAPITHGTKKYDFSAMVPLQLRNTLGFIDCIDTLIVGGAPFSQDLKKLVQDKSCQIYETYGMTETITHIAARKINHNTVEDLSASSPPFKALPEVNLSTDKRNCLVIDAPRIAEQKIVTNDVVGLISASEFLWLGRFDNIINSGGVKLIPEQIESLLSTLIQERFFVTGLSDEKLGQKLVLIIEGKEVAADVLEKIEQSGLLERFQVPKEVISLPSFKESVNGKLLRAETIRLI